MAINVGFGRHVDCPPAMVRWPLMAAVSAQEDVVATAGLTETDVRVRDAVMRQLEWDPEVDASAVGIAAKGGTVTLTGYIDSYAGKLAAERAAKRVHGVRGVANDVEVRLKLDRTDVDIANDVVRALELRSTIPDGVQAVVHNAHVTLTGKVNWLFQKREAEKAVRHIRGVRNVVNYIEVAPHAAERDVRRRIVQALHQSADVDAHHITVTLSGDTATLSGTVGTWLQRESAERAAENAPGIRKVVNAIVVEPPAWSAPDAVDEIC
jgi:osmotically-inducible protein OsmY